MPNEPAKCGGVPPPTNKPTPYGYWHCDGTEWVWIPEFGRMANNLWNRFLLRLTIKK